MSDLAQMKSRPSEVPDSTDRARRAELLASLHNLTEKNVDPASSYQYLAAVTKVREGSDVWQVKMSRRRRRRHERISDEENKSRSEEDLTAAGPVLADPHGNELLPMLEAAKRVATTKELKRIKKSTSARRRSGEECFTDDELEVKNLVAPPPPEAPMATVPVKSAGKTGGTKASPRLVPTSDGKIIKKLQVCAAVDLALESDSEGMSSVVVPSVESLRDWMGLGPSDDMYVHPNPGYLERTSQDSSSGSSGSSGFVKVSRRRFPSSMC